MGRINVTSLIFAGALVPNYRPARGSSPAVARANAGTSVAHASVGEPRCACLSLFGEVCCVSFDCGSPRQPLPRGTYPPWHLRPCFVLALHQGILEDTCCLQCLAWHLRPCFGLALHQGGSGGHVHSRRAGSAVQPTTAGTDAYAKACRKKLGSLLPLEKFCYG